MVCVSVSAYAKKKSRLCRKDCQLLVALIRLLMQVIPVHSYSGELGDENAQLAWLNGTSGYPLSLLRSLANNDPREFSRRGGGGWVDRSCVTG